MQRAHEVHYLVDKVAFSNPYMDQLGEYERPMLVAIWRPGPRPAEPPRWQSCGAQPPSRSAAPDPADRLRVRRCSACGAWRLLPRYSELAPTDSFKCSVLGEASCASPHAACSWGAS